MNGPEPPWVHGQRTEGNSMCREFWPMQPYWGTNAPPRGALRALSHFFSDLSAAAEARAKRNVSARRRCGAWRSGRRPGTPSSAPAGLMIRTRASTFAHLSGAVSWSPLLVTSRSSPAANHLFCTSPALASAVVFFLLSFSVLELAQRLGSSCRHPGGSNGSPCLSY